MLLLVQLNLADRLLVDQVLAGCTEVTIESSKTIREIRRRFAIREAHKVIERMQTTDEVEELRTVSDHLLGCLDAFECSPAITQFFVQRLDVGDVSKQFITWDHLSSAPCQDFTIDGFYMDFLRDELKRYEWKGGRDTPLPPAMVEAIADLADHLSGAAKTE